MQLIMRDFKWMSVKLILDNTIYNLCMDIEKAINFLREKDIKVLYFVLIDVLILDDIIY